MPNRQTVRPGSSDTYVDFEIATNKNWLVVSTHLKNISQIGNLPQIGVKIKNIWNHHLEKGWINDRPGRCFSFKYDTKQKIKIHGFFWKNLSDQFPSYGGFFLGGMWIFWKGVVDPRSDLMGWFSWHARVFCADELQMWSVGNLGSLDILPSFTTALFVTPAFWGKKTYIVQNDDMSWKAVVKSPTVDGRNPAPVDR